MTNRATFTLEDDAFAYLKQVGGENKSAYVNQLLLQEKKRSLKKAILQANQEESEDTAYQEDLSEWDETLADGLEA
ncbi:MAG: CopG family transcriptional regulator [Nitrospirales bacterium]|nr:CopG family transcriptional regulator [Nitrospirales bacterium]MBA3965675.1 CopG family transcriptional regulator [Nitrospirales bacterium]